MRFQSVFKNIFCRLLVGLPFFYHLASHKHFKYSISIPMLPDALLFLFQTYFKRKGKKGSKGKNMLIQDHLNPQPPPRDLKSAPCVL